MTHFIPCFRARWQFMAEHIHEAGLSHDAAREIASRLIPDVLVFDAVYVNKQDCYCEILDNGMVFLLLGGTPYFCGRYLDGRALRAAAEWDELEYVWLDNETRKALPVKGLIACYDAGRWEDAHRYYNECKFRLSVDITPTLKEFVEVEDVTIH